MKRFLSTIFIFIFFISFYPKNASADTVSCGVDLSLSGSVVWADWWAWESGSTPYNIYIDWGDGSGFHIVGKFLAQNDPAESGSNNHDFGTYTGPVTVTLKAAGYTCDNTITIPPPPSNTNCTDPSADNYNQPGSCTYTSVQLNFIVRDYCTGGGISGADVDINQDFGNGTHRTTDGSGFANFGAYKNKSVGYTVGRSGYGSGSGSINTGANGNTATVSLTPNAGCSGSGGGGGGTGVIPQPVNYTASCVAPGTTATASWTAPTGYNTFYIRVAQGAGNTTGPWILFDDNYTGTSLSFNTTAGQTYHIRVYTKDTSSGASSSYVGGDVTCSAPAANDDAQFISQSGLYSTMVTGKVYPVTISMKNIGTTNWDWAHTYGLAAQNPARNKNFYPGTNGLPSSPIAPGASLTFNFNISIPYTAGTYHFQNQMTHDAANGAIPAGFFGQMTPDTIIRAVSTPGAIASETAVCNAAGDQVTLTWGTSAGATNYLFRMDPAPVGVSPTPGCGGAGTALCLDYYSGTSYTATVVPGQSYSSWVYGNVCDDYNTNSGCTNASPASTSFTCAAPSPYSLTVTKSGRGTVSSTDNLISCGTDCAESYARNTSVTLTAVPASSYWKFTGWSGDCNGIGACVLLMNRSKLVQARFERRLFNYFEF